MRIRLAIAAVFAVLATLMVVVALRSGWGPSRDDLFLNLGTEILGIVITVAIVDWLLQRQRDASEARTIAWRALHELDHAVWVWQGGTRQFDLGELLELISLIEDDDPLPQFTQNLLLRLGSTAEATLRVSADVVRSSPQLKGALTQLAGLSSMRDSDNLLLGRAIARHLKGAGEQLAAVVGLVPISSPSEHLARVRNPAVEYQEWRHYGDRPDGKVAQAG